MNEVRDTLDGYVREALELRFAGQNPKPGDDSATVVAGLLDVRQRLDRVEELLGRALRVKARTQAAADHAAAAVADAFDRALHGARTAPVVRGDEYSSAKERDAAANLAVIDLRLAARAAVDLAAVAGCAVEVLRLAHRGLDTTRADHHVILRAVQVESTLER